MQPTTHRPALVICAHGARGVELTAEAHARAIGEQDDGRRFAEVRACALRTEPFLEDVAAALPEGPVVLVPYLMAEGYTLDVLNRRLDALPIAARTTVARAVGAHPGMAELLHDMAARSCAEAGWSPDETGMLLVGHGTPKSPTSAATAEAQAARIAERGTFAAVATAFLEQSPTVAEALARPCPARWVAVGFFTDAGEHGREDVPALLAESGAAAVYAGPVGGDPGMAGLIRDAAAAALA